MHCYSQKTDANDFFSSIGRLSFPLVHVQYLLYTYVAAAFLSCVSFKTARQKGEEKEEQHSTHWLNPTLEPST